MKNPCAGTSLDDFLKDEGILAESNSIAIKRVADYESLRLNSEDSKTFVNAILDPSAPNNALRKAAEKYMTFTKQTR